MAQAVSAWDPSQYNRFAAEREQAFWDLAALLRPVDRPVLVDLGCGDGRLTAALHGRLGAASTLGVDSSPSMLEQAAAHAGAGVSFVEADIARWEGSGVDVVFSNAALHWVPDHEQVLRRWSAALRPGGQLAVQVPANADHPSHTVLREVAAQWLGDDAPPDPVERNVLAPAGYASLLHELGCTDQHVRMQVYGHVLARSAEVVEWVKGTSLTRFKSVLGPEEFDALVAEYCRRLVAVLGDGEPYFYPFKRILLWGVVSGPG
jgi:trans-aconitate 2-methyltransferase